MPKAELHLHIEGTLEPELMFELASRNHVHLPYRSPDEVRAAYEFSDLQSFLDIYYQGTRVLLHDRDFYDLTWAYLLKAHEQSVRHAEIFFDPQAHTDRGVAIGAIIEGLYQALSDGEQKFGISSKLILSFLRHLSGEDAMQTLLSALPYRKYFAGAGLDSSERGHPPEKFTRVFSRARDEGLFLVAHAGRRRAPGLRVAGIGYAWRNTHRSWGTMHRGSGTCRTIAFGASAAYRLSVVERQTSGLRLHQEPQPARTSGRRAMRHHQL